MSGAGTSIPGPAQKTHSSPVTSAAYFSQHNLTQVWYILLYPSVTLLNPVKLAEYVIKLCSPAGVSLGDRMATSSAAFFHSVSQEFSFFINTSD